MLRNKSYITLLLTLALCLPLRSQYFSDDAKNILQIQDTRDKKKIDELYNYLNPLDAHLVKRSLVALANIADSNTINYINAVMVNSTCPDCRKTAAFAMGQLMCTNAPKYLTVALAADTEPSVVAAILESLGKTGDADALNTVVSYNSENNVINAAIAYSIDKFARRHVLSPEAVSKLSLLIHSTTDTNVIRNCANALFSIVSQNLQASADSDIIFLTSSQDPYTRMKAFGAVGFLLDPSYADRLTESLKTEPDWRVRANIVYSLGRLKYDSNYTNENLCGSLLNAVDDANDNVSIAALQALGKIYSTNASSALLPQIAMKLQWFMIPNRAVNWSVIVEAVKAYGRIFRDKAKDELLSFYRTTDDYDLKAAVISSFAYMNNGMVYKDIRKAISEDVQKYNEQNKIKSGEMISGKQLTKLYRAFCEMLVKLYGRMDTSELNNIRLILTEFLGSKDLMIINTCLEALLQPAFSKYKSETAQVTWYEYRDLTYPKDKLAMLIFIPALGELGVEDAVKSLEENLRSNDYDIASASADALKAITKKDYRDKITAQEFRTDFDWNYIDNLAQKKFVTIKTNLGEIKIELFPNEAPFTVQSFLKLAEKKYYDGIIFHRVVPNFVIQAGDPTGTGFGGPDYSIRTEISQLKFETGTLGMASTGKDTEGSQFFITHSPQPHLDGKYTVFGRVIDGMDIVDRIQVGDFIESVEVTK